MSVNTDDDILKLDMYDFDPVLDPDTWEPINPEPLLSPSTVFQNDYVPSTNLPESSGQGQSTMNAASPTALGITTVGTLPAYQNPPGSHNAGRPQSESPTMTNLDEYHELPSPYQQFQQGNPTYSPSLPSSAQQYQQDNPTYSLPLLAPVQHIQQGNPTYSLPLPRPTQQYQQGNPAYSLPLNPPQLQAQVFNGHLSAPQTLPAPLPQNFELRRPGRPRGGRLPELEENSRAYARMKFDQSRRPPPTASINNLNHFQSGAPASIPGPNQYPYAMGSAVSIVANDEHEAQGAAHDNHNVENMLLLLGEQEAAPIDLTNEDQQQPFPNGGGGDLPQLSMPTSGGPSAQQLDQVPAHPTYQQEHNENTQPTVVPQAGALAQFHGQAQFNAQTERHDRPLYDQAQHNSHPQYNALEQYDGHFPRLGGHTQLNSYPQLSRLPHVGSPSPYGAQPQYTNNFQQGYLPAGQPNQYRGRALNPYEQPQQRLTPGPIQLPRPPTSIPEILQDLPASLIARPAIQNIINPPGADPNRPAAEATPEQLHELQRAKDKFENTRAANNRSAKRGRFARMCHTVALADEVLRLTAETEQLRRQRDDLEARLQRAERFQALLLRPVPSVSDLPDPVFPGNAPARGAADNGNNHPAPNISDPDFVDRLFADTDQETRARHIDELVRDPNSEFGLELPDEADQANTNGANDRVDHAQDANTSSTDDLALHRRVLDHARDQRLQLIDAVRDGRLRGLGGDSHRVTAETVQRGRDIRARLRIVDEDWDMWRAGGDNGGGSSRRKRVQSEVTDYNGDDDDDDAADDNSTPAKRTRK